MQILDSSVLWGVSVKLHPQEVIADNTVMEYIMFKWNWNWQ